MESPGCFPSCPAPPDSAASALSVRIWNVRNSVQFSSGGNTHDKKSDSFPGTDKKEDRRGRRRSGGGFGVGYLVWGVLMKRSAGIARVR